MFSEIVCGIWKLDSTGRANMKVIFSNVSHFLDSASAALHVFGYLELEFSTRELSTDCLTAMRLVLGFRHLYGHFLFAFEMMIRCHGRGYVQRSDSN